jgi:hypothetical protein
MMMFASRKADDLGRKDDVLDIRLRRAIHAMMNPAQQMHTRAMQTTATTTSTSTP